MAVYVFFWTRGETAQEYSTATAFACCVIRWLDFVVLHSPEKDFWRARGDGSLEDRPEVPPKGVSKLRWFTGLWFAVRYVYSTILLCNRLLNIYRGVGWNIQAGVQDPLPADYPKGKFLKLTTIHTVMIYTGFDVAQNIVRIYTPPAGLFSVPAPQQVILAWANAFKFYYGIEFAYSIGALLSVTLGICKPNDWPPLCGYFRRDGWSVRKLWGNCWHQMMRRMCSSTGKFVKRICGFRTGGFMSRYSKVWVAFFMSALVHHFGAITVSFEDGGFWQAIFFMAQPIAFMAEDFVLYLGRAAGIQSGGEISIPETEW